jgi:hypothetical protein
MLKVTVKRDDSAETWELEGKLAGEWVAELERCWKGRSTSAGLGLQLNLKTVSYIDSAGKQLLTAMHGDGVQIRGGGCMIKAVVEEVTGQASPGPMAGSS